MASLATGSRSMDPASDETDGGPAATLTLPGRSHASRAHRHHPCAAHPRAVVNSFLGIFAHQDGGDTNELIVAGFERVDDTLLGDSNAHSRRTDDD